MPLNLLFGMISLILATCSGSDRSIKSPRPNIICIMVDDLGFGDLSCLGAKDLSTPHIDKIANSGMTFNNFYANCTVCSPTRASFLTGKYPDLVGVPGVIRQHEENSFGYLDPEAMTAPEILKNAGYHTALIGKWHLGYEHPNIPNSRGFDLFHGFLGDMMDDYYTHLRGGENWMRHNQEVIDPEGHATDIFTDWTVQYLEERRSKSDPFFLFLAYNAPHFPIQPPKEYLEKVNKEQPELDDKRAANVAFIEHLDFNVGRVMQSMEELELLENTVVVFTSDNGGALRFAQSNGKLRGGKQDHFEGGIKVPCFVSWKGMIFEGTKNASFAMTMDLLPTFCDLAGLRTPDEVDGESLLPNFVDGDLEKSRIGLLFGSEGMGGLMEDKLIMQEDMVTLRFYKIRLLNLCSVSILPMIHLSKPV